MRKPIHKARRGGFALIVTLSLMILLTVVAVGLLSLSSIALRSSSQGDAMATAKANARMALMLALGELQSTAGLDTRVTARADILSENNPPVLGVWKSWEGTDHETTGDSAGRPLSPGDYKAKKEGRFLRWLVSGNPQNLNAISNIPNTAAAAAKITLVGSKTLGNVPAGQQIHLDHVPVNSGRSRGAFAWWVGGENLKARLPRPYTVTNNPEWAARQKSHAVANPKVFGMDSLLTRPEAAAKAISLKQSDLIDQTGADKASRTYFHDLTTVATGLLTNTATGGWRKDLSLFTEKYADLPSTGLPLFRLDPATDNACAIPKDNATANYMPAKSMLYPWAAYRGTATKKPGERQGAMASWRHLADYALSYGKFANTDSFGLQANIQKNDDYWNGYNKGAPPEDYYKYLHSLRIMPVLARVQWVFSYHAYSDASGFYYPGILMTPVVTLWNPYNVTMRNIGNLNIITGAGGRPGGNNSNVTSPLPCVFSYDVRTGGVVTGQSDYRGLTKGYSTYGGNGKFLAPAKTFCYNVVGVPDMAPGSTLVYSPKTIRNASGDDSLGQQANITLEPGYGGLYGFRLDLMSGTSTSTRIKASAASTIQIKGIKFDNELADSNNANSAGVGVRLTVRTSRTNDFVASTYQMAYPPSVAARIYPEIPGSKLSVSSSLQVVSQLPQPFFSAMFGMRMASNTNVPAKGFVQTSPLVTFTEPDGAGSYMGTKHPVNMPFDFSFVLPSDGPGSGADPNVGSDNSGYVITGFQSADGLSRCIAADLPTQPLASLAELQHWDARYENPIPPFSFNIIGNSDATPLIPKDNVVNSKASGNGAENLQHDDSYCANHLLFDDWFFSSLAAGKPNQFGAGGTLKTVFTDFLKGVTPLANHAYQPLPGDAALATQSSGADKLYTDKVSPADSWRKIASRLEVDGMFNVNSTSVAAWRALLGHARNQKIPFYGKDGSVQYSGDTDHVLNRFTVAGDVEAGKAGASGDFSAASQFTGYRKLDDPLLDVLAKNIVEQVRLRGPFLSLSEFVNRQLSNNTNLALAGAIQTALNKLGADLYGDVEDALSHSNKYATSSPPSAADANYQFPEAAEGISVYGLPGWTRQADVLRPLAPVLSARDDTFTIRAHGDTRDASNKVTATAICEAVVRRTRDYCDPSDAADLANPPTSTVNKIFGRRFEIISFRWLASNEI